ncbi:5640_t:CDS:2 [Funneliformis mosseae]|uniref:5640_t:CDS:1 n=1 Tax=Funneliformis mosseae TaxID=27381 RepID=A0A9N8ZCI0_FUNMO|nr:5640_t:CDS:2 [Funneliformis mosseae]
MFRTKPSQNTSNPNLRSQHRKDELDNVDDKKNSNKTRKSYATKKKQKREFEPLSLGKTYMIVHLCAGEIARRGKPLRFRDGKDEVRYLISCLLEDNRREFENELSYQNIHNVVAGIRVALRNCELEIITYESYLQFTKYEQDWQYDLKEGCFNKFLSNLSRLSRGILVDLFDLFAMTMENSHNNRMHPTRILKSMSPYIFNELQSKTYENFQLAYQDWLKYSNALTHLFLAYLREKACSIELPERLHLLLSDYIERRKKCLTNSSVSENGEEVIFGEHALPDITIDLDEAIDSIDNISSLDNKQSSGINNGGTGKRIYFTDKRTARVKWDGLQNKGLNILSEEALNLLFAFDDEEINLNSTIIEKGKSVMDEERLEGQKQIDRFDLPKLRPSLPEMDFNNDASNKTFNFNFNSEDEIQIEPNNFRKKEFRESIDNDLNKFKSKFNLPNNDGDSTKIKFNETSNERKEKPLRRRYSTESIHINERNHEEKEWILIEQRSDLMIDGKNKFLTDRKKIKNKSNSVKLTNRVSNKMNNFNLPWTRGSKRINKNSNLSNISELPSSLQQINNVAEKDSIIPQPPYLKRSNTSYKQVEEFPNQPIGNEQEYTQQREDQTERYQMQGRKQKYPKEQSEHKANYKSSEEQFNDISDRSRPIPKAQDYHMSQDLKKQGNLESDDESKDHMHTSQHNNGKKSSEKRTTTTSGQRVRGKDLPYPVTPKNVGRNSSITNQNPSGARGSPAQGPQNPIPDLHKQQLQVPHRTERKISVSGSRGSPQNPIPDMPDVPDRQIPIPVNPDRKPSMSGVRGSPVQGPQNPPPIPNIPDIPDRQIPIPVNSGRKIPGPGGRGRPLLVPPILNPNIPVRQIPVNPDRKSSGKIHHTPPNQYMQLPPQPTQQQKQYPLYPKQYQQPQIYPQQYYQNYPPSKYPRQYPRPPPQQNYYENSMKITGQITSNNFTSRRPMNAQVVTNQTSRNMQVPPENIVQFNWPTPQEYYYDNVNIYDQVQPQHHLNQDIYSQRSPQPYYGAFPIGSQYPDVQQPNLYNKLRPQYPMTTPLDVSFDNYI